VPECFGKHLIISRPILALSRSGYGLCPTTGRPEDKVKHGHVVAIVTAM